MNWMLKRDHWIVVITIALILAGVLLTAHGIYELSNANPQEVNWRYGTQYLKLFMAFGLIIGAVGLWRGPLFASVLISLIVAIGAGVFFHVLAVVVLGLSAYALGRLIFPSPQVSASDCLLAGIAIFGTVFGLLVQFPVNNPMSWGLLFALPLIAGRKHVWHFLINIRFNKSESLHSYMVFCAIGAAGLLQFLVTLMPEQGHDALAMHLFVPAYVRYFQHWSFDAGTYVWAVMPMLVDWLYSAGYMFAGEAGARLVNFGSILLVSLLVYRISCWVGAKGVTAAWAVLFFLITPLTFLESSTLYIDALWSALVAGGIFAVLRLVSSQEEVKKDLLLGGIFLGGAMACKAVTFTILPILALVLLVSFRRLLSRKLLGALGLSLAAFLVVGLIPYVKAMVVTGNPVFPLFNGIFKSPFYPAVNFDPPSSFEVGFAWDTLYRMTFESGKYLESTPGAAGFQWLLLIVPGVVILLMSKNRRALLVALIAFVSLWLTFGQTSYLRYVFPSFALACAVIAAAFQSLNKNTTNRWGWYSYVMIAVITVTLNLVHFDSAGYYGNIDFRVITDERKRDGYVENIVPLRKAVAFVNLINKHKSPVAFFSDPFGAELKSEALYANWYNNGFIREVLSAGDEKQIGRILSGRKVEFVVVADNCQFQDQRHWVDLITDEIVRYGPVSVRSMKDTVQFSDEILADPTFQRTDSWQYSPGVKLSDGLGVVVTVDNPAYTIIPVIPGDIYRYTAEARCYDVADGQGRLQVNWMDKDGKIIIPAIEVFTCQKQTNTYSMDVQAPENAVQATIYASGHGPKPIVFSRISFKH